MAKTKTFSARIRDWGKRSLSAAEMVRKASTIEIVQIMQTPKSEGGRMPVDTGYLRASFVARINDIPTIDPLRKPLPGASYSYNAGAVNSVISRATALQKINLGYQAAYAAYQEYGTDKFAANAFVRLAVQQWPTIVEQNTKRVRAELGL